METQKKLDLVTKAIEGAYTSTKDFDECCGKCVGIEGISFGEIAALVKKVLIDTGQIVPVKAKLENLLIDLETLGQDETFQAFKDTIEYHSENNDLTKAVVKREIVKIYKENEWNIPKDNPLKGWKLNIVECFKRNPEITVPELTECLRSSVKGPDNADHYARLYHEFAKQLVSIQKA